MAVAKSAEQKKKNGALFSSLTLLDVAGVAKALEAGADPNAMGGFRRKEECMPALSFAIVMAKDVYFGNMSKYAACEKACRLLVAAGADVDRMAGSQGSCAPLHHACFLGRRQIVRLLLGAGANPNAMTVPGSYAPLRYALMPGTPKKTLAMEAMALDLVHAGADPSLVDGEGKRADDFASEDLRAQLASVVERKALEESQPEAKRSRPSASL